MLSIFIGSDLTFLSILIINQWLLRIIRMSVFNKRFEQSCWKNFFSSLRKLYKFLERSVTVIIVKSLLILKNLYKKAMLSSVMRLLGWSCKKSFVLTLALSLLKAKNPQKKPSEGIDIFEYFPNDR